MRTSSHPRCPASRGRSTNASRALGSFIDECVQAIPAAHRDDYQLWVRVDSAGYTADVIEACERHDAWFTITAKHYDNTRAAIYALAAAPATRWRRAKGGGERRRGSQVGETTFTFAGRELRLVVRRQPVGRDGDAQLSFDDVDGWRYHAILTNIPRSARNAVNVEAHHRLRGKRLRVCFLNVAARVVRHARRLYLRFGRDYRWATEFATALERLHALPAFR